MPSDTGGDGGAPGGIDNFPGASPMTDDEARRRVIRAMCPDRVCRLCGEPSRRVVEYGGGNMERDELRAERGWNQRNPKTTTAERVTSARTLGFSDCGHDDWRPGVWIDPFQNQEGFMLTLGNIDQ